MLALAVAMPALAQVPQYGSNVTLEQARKALTAAAAEARKNFWPVAIAIVDTAGQLVADERMDSTQTVSVLGSQDKAVSAAMYRRPSKAFQDTLAGGVPACACCTSVDGRLPRVVDGKIIGAIGVSGVAAKQDGQIAKAGVDGLAAKWAGAGIDNSPSRVDGPRCRRIYPSAHRVLERLQSIIDIR